ncbi:3-oxoacyl-[acyl-carrier-protein] synthase 2 [Abditibacteriota bacterium]|nr:3-oxoacyl-[acyl-carrier-protein] synthase 2 [Abditibacteriota bacterium]
MEQVVVTGLGVVLTNAAGIIGGWSSASAGEGIFLTVPSCRHELTDLIERESQRAFAELERDRSRFSVSWSVSKNGYNCWEQWANQGNERFFSDFDALDLARRFRFGGQVMCPVAACATGSHALILGARLIEQGEADVVLCGTSEPPQHPMILAAYRNMGALSASGVMRPFDRRRDGFLSASGSGFLILESLEHAQKRGARIHARLMGYSMRSDATHMTSMCPSGDSVVRAIEEALERAGNPAVGYVNAHGTATRLNDELEARAISRVWGNRVAVSSTKSLTGHLLGASGAIEAVLSIVAMKERLLPPTLGLEEPEGELNFVMGEERRAEVEAVLSLNYGFGGHIGAILFAHR